MSEEAVLNTGISWFKVIASITAIAGSVGGAVYWWTSKITSNNHQLTLARRDMSILDKKKELFDKDKKEQEKCDSVPIRIPKPKGEGMMSGCFKEDQ